MNSEYQSQARRLEELRRTAASSNSRNTASGSRTLSPPLLRNLAASQHGQEESGVARNPMSRSDPLIYSGLYSPSGIDVMSILVNVHKRRNPKIEIGRVDSGVALVVVDAEQFDFPLIYCSETFEALTGYTSNEILGRNCRFLQYPLDGSGIEDKRIIEANSTAKNELYQKIMSGEEAQVRLLNYKKDGTLFANLLTIIPILWGEEDQVKKRYIVGFQAEERMR